MKNIFISLLFLGGLTLNSNAQGILDENFDSYGVGFDITKKGYTATMANQGSEGEIKATVAREDGKQFVYCFSKTNGPVNMVFKRKLTVEANKGYSFQVDTKSSFKRNLVVYNAENGRIIQRSNEYIPAEDGKKSWKSQHLDFTTPNGVTEVEIGVFQTWSGFLGIDNFNVRENKVVNKSSSQEDTKTEDGSQKKKVVSTSYYLSTTKGNDANKGDKNSPWKSMAKLNNIKLNPGDSIFFMRGNRFDGHFTVNGSGTSDKPIVITAFGTGAKPIITGEVGAENGGDFGEAIVVNNNDNMVFEGLDIRNERKNTRTGVKDVDAFGIQIINSGDKVMKNFTFRNMTFQNVYAVQPMTDRSSFDALEVSGLRIISMRNAVKGKEKNIQDILVEHCYFTNIQRLGVYIKHDGGIDEDSELFINRNANIVIRNNEFHYLGGTSVLPFKTYKCLIEDNIFDHPGASTDPRMPGRGSSVWTFHCVNTVIQYNYCLSTRGYLDSHGIHADHSNINTFIQYNYMEDCEGGFVEILKGNKNAVYRYNLSVNDGWRNSPTWTNSNHTIWIDNGDTGKQTDLIIPSDSSFVYNNTIILDKEIKTSIAINGKNTFIFNNIFYAMNGGAMGSKQMSVKDYGTTFLVSNNNFYGNIATSFKSYDKNPVATNPFSIQSIFKYQLSSNSALIDQGLNAENIPVIPGAGEGVFASLKEVPEADFFGNPIRGNKKVNIGASNVKSFDTPVPTQDLLCFPGLGAVFFVKLGNQSARVIDVDLLDMRGNIAQSNKAVIKSANGLFEISPNASLTNGIYKMKVKSGDLQVQRRIFLFR